LSRSFALAQAVLRQLLAAGVRDVVVAPGSRNAPLSWVAADLAKQDKIRLHVRIDERAAGFLALGLTKLNRNPVAVIVTSGSAVANLWPGVTEAEYSGLPLVVVSADRPAAARGIGAAQTIDQQNFFGSYVRAACDINADDLLDAQESLRQVLEATHGAHRGPVQLNVQFDLPLLPDAPQPVAFDPAQPITVSAISQTPAVVSIPSETLIIAGDITDPVESEFVSQLAVRLALPILWEPSSNTHTSENAISHGVALLASELAPTPQAIITVGTVGLSRPVISQLKNVPIHFAVRLASSNLDIPDPARSADAVFDGFPDFVISGHEEHTNSWLESWQEADQKAATVISNKLQRSGFSGPSAAVTLWSSLSDDATLCVAASWAVRHIESFAPARKGVRVLGNRGTNGIDGLISTAQGVALNAPARTYLLIGDIAFLHDVGSLNLPLGQPQPNLTIVVLDNDGGGVFSQLEQGAAQYREHFETIFGTPHGHDLWVIAESFGISSSVVTSEAELTASLARTNPLAGMHVIVCKTGNRGDENTLLRSVTAALVEL
jgi:2-succinyl-5-enolpyruvyl-6-hydroxy-3-cyclohexene-1-carboxylate synthase